MAGIENKDKDFWRGLGKWDIIALSQTWMGEVGEGWKKIRRRLPGGYMWEAQFARRNRKGRAMGGMIMGIRREMLEKGTKIETEREGIIIGRVKQEEERWRVVGVYVNKNMEESLQGLGRWMEEAGEGIKTIIGGDFNARTGRERGSVEIEKEDKERERGKRKSKDGKVNKKGKMLIEFVEERGWSLFNGNIEGDEKGEYTFTGGKGNTVIDYVMGDEEVRERIEKMEIGDEIDSDHQPVKVRIRGEGGKKSGVKKEGKGGRGRWDEEGRRLFRRKLRKIELGKKDTEKEWKELERRLKRAMKETEKEQDKKEEKKKGLVG